MPRYIDADEVKKAIEESWDGCLGAYDSHEITMNDLWVIDKAPTADVVERKKGKWIDDKGLYKCSCCKHLWAELWWTAYCPMDRMYKTMPFCPNCGAEMEADDGEIH